MYLHIGNDKLLMKYETIQTKIGDLQNIELNALPVYDDRYIKTKIRPYADKVYTNFRSLNMPKVVNNMNLLQSFQFNLFFTCL